MNCCSFLDGSESIAFNPHCCCAPLQMTFLRRATPEVPVHVLILFQHSRLQADNLQTSESLKKKSCGASIVAYWLSIPRCCWCHSSRNALLNFNYLAWSSRSSRVSLLLFLALRKNSSQRMKATDSVEANQMTYSSAQFSITKEVPCVSFPSLSLLTIGA